MANGTNRASRAGGAIIAFSILAGAVIGLRNGESSIGMLAGTIVGVAISLALYFFDRRRER